MLNKILTYYDIRKMSNGQALKVSIRSDYSSEEEMKKSFSEKSIKYTWSDEAREKRKNKCLEKYGSVSPFGNKDVQEKTRKTFIQNYGVDNPRKADTVKEKIRKTNVDKYGGIGFQSEQLFSQYKEKMLGLYGVEYGCLTEQCKTSSHGSNSLPNEMFSKLLDANHIQYEKEFVLENKRFDFKVSDILIEINPTITHNSTVSYRNKDLNGLDKNYHKDKTMLAERNGFRCIQVFDWDDIENIVKLLLPRKKIYARQCNIKEIDQDKCKEFINDNHIQGFAKCKICIGLEYEGNIVSVMTFDKPRYNKNYEYELIRYCSSYSVVGGAEKILNFFIKNYNPESIISYCDLSKFSGKTYEKLGFKPLKETVIPSKHWYNIKTKKHITDNLLRSKGFDKLFNENYGKGTSNRELMLQHGFLEVYDCGQKSFILTNINK